MTLSEAASLVQGELSGADREFLSVATDTRRIADGALFVALKGERFDGHDFLAEAHARGAAGALVQRADARELAQIRVGNTHVALGALAAGWRLRFAIPVIAVTGSNGKTTVKEMIAAILRVRAPGLATTGNLNNDIGVPLTLLGLRARDRFAVVEMGMNHAGEIARLAQLTRPSVAVITNAQSAHLEGLGTVEAVARAKGEIFEGLDADGVAIVNADDPHAALWRELAGARRVVSFGLHAAADVSARYRLEGAAALLTLRAPQGEVAVRLELAGAHNVCNALAASAAALACGADLRQVQTGLETLRPVPGRLHLRAGRNGARVFDDSYNANPDSVRAALAVLAAAPGERLLVLGDMAELGAEGIELHRQIGAAARAAGIEHLFALGELTRHTVAEAGPGARHFDSHAALAEAAAAVLKPALTVVVKGSRRMRMEDIVGALTGTSPGMAH
jgi:UDP-N-acetylmuramoyl-tripeptide--D-alanyl-D-alanine ligase